MITREEYVVIHTLYKQGYSIRGISKITGLDRRTISKRLKQGIKQESINLNLIPLKIIAYLPHKFHHKTAIKPVQ